MTWRLQGIGHPQEIVVGAEGPVVVGRAPDTDRVIADVTVSRRHAELTATPLGVAIRDLGSSNGTSINGTRTPVGQAMSGDTIVFGKVAFRLHADHDIPEPPADLPPEGAIVRKVTLGATPDTNLESAQLARILDLAKRLSGEIDPERLTTAIVDLTFDLLPVDRVALLLIDEASGELIPANSKTRLDNGTGTRVPRSIAMRAVLDRAPILTESAVDDERFRSGSVMLQSVRGAICTPLMASKDQCLGVLYVDTLTATRPFREDEASMLYAFGGLAAVSLSKLAYAETMRRDAQVRANFERFFAPEVALRIAKEKGVIGLAGERRAVTVLFSDIRGFTAMAETMAPETLGSLLTEYFSEMVDIVFDHGGTLDKFIGDAIMAVWGAPLAGPGDADRALEAAVAMQRRMGQLNARWEAAGQVPLSIGIGINYGDVFAGYLGSERRLEYSVIGDAVNVASRLCDDAAPGEIRLAEPFVQQLTTRPILTRLPDIELKHRQNRVVVFSL
ncbi:MAG: FHA domain-containing protein [Gemmatimonadetes bacterium]|nr:FHA domain-containing protein [Gemmatimonadota bacterium]